MKIIHLICNIFYKETKNDANINIFHLPYDILNLIIQHHNNYNLIFVCKILQNTLCKTLTKCHICDKNVKINNDILWVTNNNDLCHTEQNYIEIKTYKIFHNFLNTTKYILDILTWKNNYGNLVIKSTNVILKLEYDEKIQIKSNNNYGLTEHIGTYKFKLYGLDNICINSITCFDLSLVYEQNKYTKKDNLTLNIVMDTKQLNVILIKQ